MKIFDVYLVRGEGAGERAQFANLDKSLLIIFTCRNISKT